MKISSIRLQHFKRFTDLSLENIPEDAKLVLLIGTNGSGKSSIFDAFNYAAENSKAQMPGDATPRMHNTEYFQKGSTEGFKISIRSDHGTVDIQPGQSFFSMGYNRFYGRTSFRQLPELTRKNTGIGPDAVEHDTDRPNYFIDRDNRFENDIEKITGEILEAVFRANKSTEEIKNKYVDPVNRSLQRIFAGEPGTTLQLIEIIPPLDGKVARITFRKGVSEIHYNYLSAGEKEVFNLLINFLSRSSIYQDTVYYIDEMDLHLNTSVQFALLKEITEYWLPANSQLWTASHSLGFIEYARQSNHACILDFDNLDFDVPQVIQPQVKDRPEIYEVAVGKEFLASIFRNVDIVFVENTDKAYYAQCGIEHTAFIGANNRDDVAQRLKQQPNYRGIIDRDFLTDADIKLISSEFPRLKILRYYSIESYLYHPDNLQEYYTSIDGDFNADTYKEELKKEAERAMENEAVKIATVRATYKFFAEAHYNQKPELQNRFKPVEANFEQTRLLVLELASNNFEQFYTFLPMKKYGTSIAYRQNIPPTELARTKWFRKEVAALLAR